MKVFSGDRVLTTAHVAGEFGDAPAGCLCRNIAVLAKADVLQVVAERRVHGALRLGAR